MASTTKTQPKAIHSDLTVDPASLTKAQRRVTALDEWENLNSRCTALSAKRLTARDKVLALGKHGMKVKASSGEEYRLRDEKVETNQHAKVAQHLAEKAGMTPAQLKKLYAQLAGTSTKREINKA